MLEKNHYDVFFTGGLDSAYRLCQLAQDENAIVQPIYLLFPNDGKSKHVRPETKHEIEAQDKILDYIYNHPNTKAEILPIKRMNGSDFRFPDMDKWEKLLLKANLGWQYLYCSSFSHQHKGVELCQEIFPKGYHDRQIFKFGKDDYGRTIIMPNENKSVWFQNYVRFLWGDMSYPVYGVTRQQMKVDLKKWHYDGIWKLIWFCYKSIDDKPCGVCDNCVAKISEGLLELFEEKALRRFYISLILNFMFNAELRQLYCQYVYDGEEKFFSYLVSNNLYNSNKDFERYYVLKIEKILSMKLNKLKHLYEYYLRDVRKTRKRKIYVDRG